MPWPNAAQFSGSILRGAIAVYFIPLLLAAALGFVLGPRNFWIWTLAIGPIVYFSAIHAVFLGSLRYRLPAEYPLSIAAAVGLGRIWMWLTPHRHVTVTGTGPASRNSP